MISFISIIIALAILALTAIQSAFVISYISFIERGRGTKSQPEDQLNFLDSDPEPENHSPPYRPKVAIILCLRGVDASLIDCLTGLYALDYPEYELHLAFDSANDPAKSVVDDFFAKSEIQPEIHVFDPIETCSLKCAAIIHTIRELSESIEVIAFVDADTVVDENWLTDLVEPLSDEKIGVTTGNRWFSPDSHPSATLVQKIWNAAAVVQMYLYEVAWGGSMAMRRDVIDQCELLDVWSRTFCEDTILSHAFRTHGYQVHRVPNLILDNNERATVSQTFSWMVRQILTVKLHHLRWKEILLHGLLTGLTTIVAPVLAIAFFAMGYWQPALSIIKAWMVYQVFNMGLLWWIGHVNRKTITSREAYNSANVQIMPHFGEFVYATFLTQILHPLATLKAFYATCVNWRGVDYRISGNRLRIHKMGSSHDLADHSDDFPEEPGAETARPENDPDIITFPDGPRSKAN